jgi:hypothetical protein
MHFLFPSPNSSSDWLEISLTCSMPAGARIFSLSSASASRPCSFLSTWDISVSAAQLTKKILPPSPSLIFSAGVISLLGSLSLCLFFKPRAPQIPCSCSSSTNALSSSPAPQRPAERPSGARPDVSLRFPAGRALVGSVGFLLSALELPWPELPARSLSAHRARPEFLVARSFSALLSLSFPALLLCSPSQAPWLLLLSHGRPLLLPFLLMSTTPFFISLSMPALLSPARRGRCLSCPCPGPALHRRPQRSPSSVGRAPVPASSSLAPCCSPWPAPCCARSDRRCRVLSPSLAPVAALCILAAFVKLPWTCGHFSLRLVRSSSCFWQVPTCARARHPLLDLVDELCFVGRSS